jgi:hypothetical protein
MILFDSFDSVQAAHDIITRSDQVPTDHERYGQWARKFYGGGYHQAFKDIGMAMTGNGRVRDVLAATTS